MDYQNKELVSYVIQSLKKIAKQYKALFVKFDPSLFLSKQLIGQENTETPCCARSDRYPNKRRG